MALPNLSALSLRSDGQEDEAVDTGTVYLKPDVLGPDFGIRADTETNSAFRLLVNECPLRLSRHTEANDITGEVKTLLRAPGNSKRDVLQLGVAAYAYEEEVRLSAGMSEQPTLQAVTADAAAKWRVPNPIYKELTDGSTLRTQGRRQTESVYLTTPMNTLIRTANELVLTSTLRDQNIGGQIYGQARYNEFWFYNTTSASDSLRGALAYTLGKHLGDQGTNGLLTRAFYDFSKEHLANVKRTSELLNPLYHYGVSEHGTEQGLFEGLEGELRMRQAGQKGMDVFFFARHAKSEPYTMVCEAAPIRKLETVDKGFLKRTRLDLMFAQSNLVRSRRLIETKQDELQVIEDAGKGLQGARRAQNRRLHATKSAAILRLWAEHSAAEAEIKEKQSALRNAARRYGDNNDPVIPWYILELDIAPGGGSINQSGQSDPEVGIEWLKQHTTGSEGLAAADELFAHQPTPDDPDKSSLHRASDTSIPWPAGFLDRFEQTNAIITKLSKYTTDSYTPALRSDADYLRRVTLYTLGMDLNYVFTRQGAPQQF